MQAAMNVTGGPLGLLQYHDEQILLGNSGSLSQLFDPSLGIGRIRA